MKNLNLTPRYFMIIIKYKVFPNTNPKPNPKVLHVVPVQNKLYQFKTNCTSSKQIVPVQNQIVPESILNYNNNTPGKNYIGLTEGTFKQRYTQHKLSFRHRKYANSTELSKHIWKLKDENKKHSIKWSIITTASPYSNASKRCNLCLTEKLYIIKADKSTHLNKRAELISICCLENKFYLMNYKNEMT